MPLEIIEFRADKYQLSKCNARIHVGEVRGTCVGGGRGGGGHRRAVVRMVD